MPDPIVLWTWEIIKVPGGKNVDQASLFSYPASTEGDAASILFIQHQRKVMENKRMFMEHKRKVMQHKQNMIKIHSPSPVGDSASTNVYPASTNVHSASPNGDSGSTFGDGVSPNKSARQRKFLPVPAFHRII